MRTDVMKTYFAIMVLSLGASTAKAQHEHMHDMQAAEQHEEHAMGAMNVGKVMLDKLEAGDDDTQRWDAQIWVSQIWDGGDRDRLWLKSEGERADDHTENAELQALYSRAISPFFDLQAGARHDFRPTSRDWLAIGVQGLAPYFFETEATLFVGEAGRSALRLKASYDLRFTQRLILAPELELNAYGEDDADTGVGSGLSDLEFGLRLRYEIAREFAPYIGAVWTHQYGDTADFTRTEGGDANDVQWVAGVRLWF